MIGETVYHYRIIDKIGEGGMGIVYRAEDINLRRTVALKFLSPVSIAGGSTRERVMKEARAAASLDHQNICAIHEVEELDDQLFIVMAYCEGRTLGRILRDDRPSLKESLDILVQIADGLCAAHEEGIIHRDIKPANVIVSEKGKVKIMDFGLAKQSGADTLSMTMAGAGTVAYMSPEQVRGDKVDRRSDVWSLGVLMYQMLTGKKPFEGEYDASVLYKIVNEPHDSARDLEPDIPPEVNAIVERALAKSPGDRYESMAQMRDDIIGIRNVLFGEPDTTTYSRGFLTGTGHIFGWKMTSILALSISAVLLFFFVKYVIEPKENGPSGAVREDAQVTQGSSSEEKSLADNFYNRGRELYNSGHQIEGADLMEEALEIDPYHLASLKTLANYYSWGKDSGRALELADRAKMIASTKEDILSCSAIGARVRHQWNMAVQYYRDLYKLDPSRRTVPIHIGYILSKYLGDFEGAMKQFELFLEIDPEDELGRHGDVHNYIGTALLYSGDLEGALREYHIYERMVPDSPGPATSLANAYHFSGDYVKAYDLYSSLLSMDDPGFIVYEGLGKACMETGRLRESIEFFHHYLGSVDFTGMKVQGLLYLARIHLLQHDPVSFDRVMSDIDGLDPESIAACWLRGIRSLELDNDAEGARRQLSMMISLMERPFAFPEPSKKAHLRSLILFSEGRHTGAFEAMEEAERRSPREFLFYGKEYARLLLESGRTERAVSKCRELRRYNPNDPDVLMLMCRAHDLTGNKALAGEYYQKVLDVLSDADADYVPLIRFKEECEGMTDM